MIRLDAHQHFWKYSPAEYGWISDSMKTIRRDFLPDDLRAACEASGVAGSIAVQAQQTVAETQWLLEIASQNDFIRGVVGWVPLIDRRAGEMVEDLAQDEKLRGVRHVLQDEADPRYMLRDDFNDGIRSLKGLRLTYDILVYERHLPQTIEFVDRHSAQVFILDHLGKPRVAAQEIKAWRENLAELAKRPNVYCKLSGLITEADHTSWNEAELLPYLDCALDVFGARRLMFGSDWPVLLLAASYSRWVTVMERVVGRLSETEQERIWSGTALEAYGLPSSSCHQ